MKKILGGIRPTGKLHLGNYYGSIIHFLKMQKTNECYFLIADWHSLTTHPNLNQLNSNVFSILSECLACGIDPEKTIIYRQSDIPEIAQLYLLLNMLAPIGELQKTASFKDKIDQNPNNINAGLFTYPVLMASDILIMHADCITIGKDQEQHLEMTCRYARRFNLLYGDYFKEPISYTYGNRSVKIPGLNGDGKMEKSKKNCIYLMDDPKTIEKKIKNALTDQGPKGKNTSKPNCIANLFTILRTVSSIDKVNYYENLWKIGATKWYNKLKQQLVEDIIQVVNPIRQRMIDASFHEEYLRKIIHEGSEKARKIAKKTIQEINQLTGFKPF